LNQKLFVFQQPAKDQVNLAQQQYSETRLKRLEAEDVLNKAKHVFGLASTASHDMMVKASSILDNANNAVIKSKEVLTVAENITPANKQSNYAA